MVETAPAFYKIFVSDLERSIAFYSACLGFREQRRIDAGLFDEVILTPGTKGASLVLCRWKDAREIRRSDAHGPTGFFVDRTDRISDIMIENGATAILGPVDYAGMRIAVLEDPDGHQIELLSKLA